MSTSARVRILGVDYGEKRVGIALSDELGMLAHPWGMVPMSAEGLGHLRDLVDKEAVTTVIVGMPLSLNGEKGPKAKEVQSFIRRLRGILGSVPIIEWDERFTTSQAERTLRTLEPKKSGRSGKTGRVDAMAASILLQSYLDSTKR